MRFAKHDQGRNAQGVDQPLPPVRLGIQKNWEIHDVQDVHDEIGVRNPSNKKRATNTFQGIAKGIGRLKEIL